MEKRMSCGGNPSAKELAFPIFHITSCVSTISPAAAGCAFFTLTISANKTDRTHQRVTRERNPPSAYTARAAFHGLCGAPRRSTSQSSPSTGGSARSSHRTPKRMLTQYRTARKPVPRRTPSGTANSGRTFSIPVTRAQKRPGRYKYTAAQRKKTNIPHSFAPDTRMSAR